MAVDTASTGPKTSFKDAHSGRDVIEYRWFDKISVTEVLGLFTAEQQARALFLADSDIVQIGFPLLLIDGWTHIDGLVQTGADFDFLGGFDEPPGECLFDRRIGDHPRCRRAALSGGTEGAAVNGNGCLVQIGIGHHDDRVFTAHLTGHLGAALGRFNIEGSADFVGSGK